MHRLLLNQKIAPRRKAAAGASRRRPGGAPRYGALSSRPLVVATVLFGALALVLVTASARRAHTGSASPPTASGSDSLGGGQAGTHRIGASRHVIRPGETLTAIAAAYGVEADELARYNGLSDPNTIRADDVLLVPSAAAPSGGARSVAPATRKPAPRPAEADSLPALPAVRPVVDVEPSFLPGGAVVARFSVQKADRGIEFRRIEWDLGGGRRAEGARGSWTYTDPGIHELSARVLDNYGRWTRSRSVVLDVPPPAALRTQSQRFVTLGRVGDTFSIAGEVTAVGSYEQPEQAPLREVPFPQGPSLLRAEEPGFYAVRTRGAEGIGSVFAFVSPVDSVHVDREDVNWYRTQSGTGPGSGSNCGPAVVSMAIGWATGDYVPVATVRDELGWHGEGGTSFAELASALRRHGVSAGIPQIRSAQDIFDVLARGNLVIVLFQTGGVRRSVADPALDLFGRYYEGDVRHYTVIKGYAKDLSALVVYDPMPVGWFDNSYRARDGISMMGRNRYYPTEEIMGALQSLSILEIER